MMVVDINKNKSAVMVIVFLLQVMNVSGQIYPLEYLEHARENNNALQAALKSWEAAGEEAVMQSALPDPVLQAGIFTPAMNRLMGKQWFEADVMQMFPWPGTRSRQRKAANAMADAAWQKYREQRNMLYMELTEVWLEISMKDIQRRLVEQTSELLRQREDIIYTRYEGMGGSAALDIYRLQIQLEEWENRSLKLGQEIQSLTESFNLLAGREITLAVITPDTLSALEQTNVFSVADTSMFATNAAWQMAQADAAAAAQRQQLSRLMTRPMIGLGVQYSYFAPGDAAMQQMDGGHMLMPMVSVSLPLFGRKNRATRLTGELMAQSANLISSNTLNRLQVQWTQLATALENLQHDLDFYSRQRQILDKAYTLVMSGYSAGSEGFDELLEIQNQLLELQWMVLEATTSQHMILAEMEMVRGVGIFE